MSLIKCFECEREVSEIAETCPGCGAPVVSEVKDHASRVGWYREVSGLMIFVPMAWLAFGAYVGGPEEFLSDLAWAKWVMGWGLALYVLGEIGRNFKEAAMKKRRNRPGT